uniref:Ankyrin repeat protein n=1 Tax=Pithovirus LCPAC102 TaxID=2506587 RepID=A0A4D5XFC4_9VIRU|nr:MAG: hypothetical protein LCPAC102_01980 [Pithovirus LCPAC102]
MYAPKFDQHDMNIKPTYDLIKINEEMWNSLKINKNINNKNLLFNNNIIKKTVKQSWEHIQRKLKELNKKIYINNDMKNNVIIAGGAIFSILFGLPINDIDLFIQNADSDKAYTVIYDFLKLKYTTTYNEINTSIKLLKSYNFEFSMQHSNIYMLRTKNAFTLNIKNDKIQFILRLYKSMSEILHGFDIDSCCIGYDGVDVWMTQRAFYSIYNGYNTVNFNYLSPSYEHRLAKYGIRGMSVMIPNININNIQINKLDNILKYEIKNVDYKYQYIKKSKGIDILLLYDYRIIHTKNFYKKSNIINKLCDEHNDYTLVPYDKLTDSICDDLDYLLDDDLIQRNYSQYYDKYKLYSPYLIYIMDPQYTLYNNIPDMDKIYSDESDPYAICSHKYFSLISPYDIVMNKLLDGSKYTFIKIKISDIDIDVIDISIEFILEIPEFMYIGYDIIKKWDISRKIEFKITNPGEQMTNTFNSIVLNNNDEWYKGQFYKI